DPICGGVFLCVPPPAPPPRRTGGCPPRPRPPRAPAPPPARRCPPRRQCRYWSSTGPRPARRRRPSRRRRRPPQTGAVPADPLRACNLSLALAVPEHTDGVNVAEDRGQRTEVGAAASFRPLSSVVHRLSAAMRPHAADFDHRRFRREPGGARGRPQL